jgi:uncharacterized protein
MVGAGPSTLRRMPLPNVDLGVVVHVLEIAWRRDSHLHGESHWHAVTATGLDLALHELATDVEIVFLFGLLHDTRRESDGEDVGHGPRAASLARELQSAGVLRLGVQRLALLAFALERHAFGEVSADPSVGACWDADRLHLPRVGTTVSTSLLSTEAARRPGALTAAQTRGSDPVDWASLVERLAEHPPSADATHP